MILENALKAQLCNNKESNLKHKLRGIAFTLRKAVMGAENRKLPENITVDDIEKGKIDAPPILGEFIQHTKKGHQIQLH